MQTGENLYTHRDENIFRTWGLMAVFLVLVIAVGFVVSYIYNNQNILYFAVIFAFLMNIISYWNSDKIVLSMMHAKPITKGEYADLYNITENLAITAGLPMPRLYLIEESSPNAFATGRNPSHGVICVTSGLVALLSKDELEGVIAHEMSHIGNRDTLISTVAVILAGLIAIISDIALRSRFSSRNNDRGGGFIQILGIIFIILSPIAATLIRLAVSRKREFLADATGALLTRYPEGLANALKKIESQINQKPFSSTSNATAHLFIENPFGTKSLSGIGKLFMTHPPVAERVSALIGNRNNL